MGQGRFDNGEVVGCFLGRPIAEGGAEASGGDFVTCGSLHDAALAAGQRGCC